MTRKVGYNIFVITYRPVGQALMVRFQKKYTFFISIAYITKRFRENRIAAGVPSWVTAQPGDNRA